MNNKSADELDGKLKNGLLELYYKGKDGKSYTETDLNRDIGLIKSLIQAEVRKARVDVIKNALYFLDEDTELDDKTIISVLRKDLKARLTKEVEDDM